MVHSQNQDEKKLIAWNERVTLRIHSAYKRATKKSIRSSIHLPFNLSSKYESKSLESIRIKIYSKNYPKKGPAKLNIENEMAVKSVSKSDSVTASYKQLPSPPTTATDKTIQSATANFIIAFLFTVYDVFSFLAVSIGYIFMDLFFKIVGRPEKMLLGEVALVTGGGGKLGRLIASKLSKLGAVIVIWDIDQLGINATIKMIRNNGGNCFGYNVDISKREEIYKAADAIRSDFGDITILVNNAGVVSGRAFLDTPDHLIERTFNVNILAHFWTTKTFLPAMLERDHGHIVTIASLAGHTALAKLVDYSSSKFAAVGFDEALRLELKLLGNNVQTTCISPYLIHSTGMFDDAIARYVPKLAPEYVANRIVFAIQRNERMAVIPRYLQLWLGLRWFLPWECGFELVRRLIPDASPTHDIRSQI